MKSLIILSFLIITIFAQEYDTCECDEGSTFVPKDSQCTIINEIDNYIPNCAIASSSGTAISDETLYRVNNCSECEAGYFLEYNKCYKFRENCEIQTSKDGCDQCKTGYFIEYIQLNGKYTQICSLANTIKNCHTYLGKSTCEKCKTGFYLYGSECKNVESRIANCVFYQSSEKCLSCDEGYHLNLDMKSCHTNLDNCQLNSSLTDYKSATSCTYCIDGYYFDKKASSPNCIQNSSPGSGGIIKGCVEYKNNYFGIICQKGDGITLTVRYASEINSEDKIVNCKSHYSKYVCALCDSGFSSIDGNCVKHPNENKITNCLQYSYTTEFKTIQACVSCELGYYPKYLGTGFISECKSCPSSEPKPMPKKESKCSSSASTVNFSVASFLLVLLVFLSL